jgi:hypothetical protein
LDQGMNFDLDVLHAVLGVEDRNCAIKDNGHVVWVNVDSRSEVTC